jgi:hypothetical protein
VAEKQGFICLFNGFPMSHQWQAIDGFQIQWLLFNPADRIELSFRGMKEKEQQNCSDQTRTCGEKQHGLVIHDLVNRIHVLDGWPKVSPDDRSESQDQKIE